MSAIRRRGEGRTDLERQAIQIPVGGAQLCVVPAVPYRLPFSFAVHRLCSDCRTRPDAIAVQIGPTTATAAARLLADLGVGPERRATLPCMLGLIRPSNRIRASKRLEALRLQEREGKHLHKIDPKLLWEHLSYCGAAILPISSTDATIEAIRCAVELDIPLYGVDLEHAPAAARPNIDLQDPLRALEIGVPKYAEQSVNEARRARAEDVDGRREQAMARRLKAICGVHDRVLFVSSLEHFNGLEMLQDPELASAQIPSADETEQARFRRVVLHPHYAIEHMDALPAITTLYEEHRRPAWVEERFVDHSLPEVAPVFDALLETVFERHVDDADEPGQAVEPPPAFARFTSNLSTVRSPSIPSLLTLMEAAKGTMSPAFSDVLASVALGARWAMPSDFPDYELIRPVEVDVGQAVPLEYVARDGERSGPFYAQSHAGRLTHARIGLPVDPWRDEIEPSEESADLDDDDDDERDFGRGRHVPARSWPPNDVLVTAMAGQASRMADEARPLKKRARDEELEAQLGPDKTVFIFDLEPPDSTWLMYAGSLSVIEPHVTESDRLREARRDMGDTIVEGLAYTRFDEPPERAPDVVKWSRRASAILPFAQLHFSAPELAAWVEASKYRKCPIIAEPPSTSPRGLFRELAKRGLDTESLDWVSTLVGAAVLYARRRVHVVAPRHCRLNRGVRDLARSHGVSISMVPLSRFPADWIDQASRIWMVEPVDPEGFRFSAKTEYVLGPAHGNRDLIPVGLIRRDPPTLSRR